MNTELDSQAIWVFGVTDVSFYMLSMGLFTTSHWLTSGRVVQELNICTAGNKSCSVLVNVIVLTF